MTAWPEYSDETFEMVCDAIESQRWAIAQSATPEMPAKRSYIDRVEEKLAEIFSVDRAITTCNGSAAIVIALQALGIGPGDGVLCPAMTWIGCATSIMRVGAVPIFVDASEDAPLMDLQTAKDAADACRLKVKAILAVHLYDHRLDIAMWKKEFPGVRIVEDSSHSFCISNDADITICSLQATKILTCGEGGVAFTNNMVLGKHMEALRADGRVRDASHQEGLTPWGCQGANYAMSEISAALLLSQLNMFVAQCCRRAAGLAVFRVATSSAALTGKFHGVLLGYSDANSMITRFNAGQYSFGIAGWKLSRVYPPITSCPQFNPMPKAHMITGYWAASELPIARIWHNYYVVVPHEAFLEPEEKILRTLGV